jgi:gamma-glutamyl-gamma-aminobutyrate hydrolase PuuD
MWYEARYPLEARIEQADIVCFIGGHDISPALYQEKLGPKMHKFSVDAHTDDRDIAAWKKTRADQIKVGICRGGQFLNVMNGGKMIQHVDNHTIEHEMFDTLLGSPEPVTVTSSHHQMMVPAESAEIIAYSENRITECYGQNGPITKPAVEPEVLWYDNTRSLCFQPHPEWEVRAVGKSKSECRDYFFNIFDMLR